MSYVIAFSNEGATDVTRRYVRNASSQGLDRNRAPEEVLLYIMNEITQMRRENLSKDEKRRLIRDDQREERELRSYVVLALTSEIERIIPSSPVNGNKRSNAGSGGSGGSGGSSEIKLPSRQTGTETWRRARGENGTNGPQDPASDPSRREGQ